MVIEALMEARMRGKNEIEALMEARMRQKL